MKKRQISQFLGDACINPEVYEDSEITFNVQEANNYFDNFSDNKKEEDVGDNEKSQKTNEEYQESTKTNEEYQGEYNPIYNDIYSLCEGIKKTIEHNENELDLIKNTVTLIEAKNVRSKEKKRKSVSILKALSILTIITIYHILMYNMVLFIHEGYGTDNTDIRKNNMSVFKENNVGLSKVVNAAKIEFFEKQLEELKAELEYSKAHDQRQEKENPGRDQQ